MTTFLIIIMGISFLVLAGLLGFGYLLLKSLPAGFDNRYPLDFLLCLSDELTVMRQLGWTETRYSNLGKDNPIVHLSKDDNKAELMLKTSEKQSESDVLLTINGTMISLRGISNLPETISSLESSSHQDDNSSA